MIALKPGVSTKGIQSELVVAVLVLADVYNRNHCSFVITSFTDGTHMAGSRHYTGHAFDCRTRDISMPLLAEIVKEAKANLGSDYDVVLEDDHMHVEWDPK